MAGVRLKRDRWGSTSDVGVVVLVREKAHVISRNWSFYVDIAGELTVVPRPAQNYATLKEARAAVPAGMKRTGPSATDGEAIVETWM